MQARKRPFFKAKNKQGKADNKGGLWRFKQLTEQIIALTLKNKLLTIPSF
jgi:hypothetical protein